MRDREAIDAAAPGPASVAKPGEAKSGRGAADAEADDLSLPVEIALADKNPLVLAAMRRLFSRDERFSVVVTATDGERFLDAVDRVPFRVGVIGWLMPFCDGRCVLEALRGRAAAPRIVVYTGSPERDVPRSAMALGASGFCAKSRPPEELVETVLAVAQGRMMFPFIDVRLLNADPLGRLTARERELLAALPAGLSNDQLAHKFGVSVNTIKFHLKSLYGKLGARNRAQAVAQYLARQPG